jgi:O-antigen/teichoic acid export membrane protein
MGVRRIGWGVAAQAYSQGVTVLLQLATTPLLIAVWGAAQYGIWIILSALPAYLVLLDLGFSQTAANDMSMKLAQGDRAGARRTFESLLALFLIVILPVLALAAIVLWIIPADWLARDPGAALQSFRGAIAILICYVAASTFSGIVSAALRAEGSFSLMVALNTTSRLLEGLGIVVVARFLGAGIFGAAAAMLLLRALATVAMMAVLHAKSDLLRLRIGEAELADIRRLLWPSLTYLGFPLGNALSLQGVLIIIGYFLSPAVVTGYATSRTLARLGVSTLGAINHVFLFEYAVRIHDSRRLFRLGLAHLAIEAIGSVFFFGLLWWLGGRIYGVWLGGRVVLDPQLFLIVVVQSALETVWAAAITPLIAWNRHSGVAACYVALSLFAMVAIALVLSAGGSLAHAVAMLAILFALLSIDALMRLRRLLRPPESHGLTAGIEPSL